MTSQDDEKLTPSDIAGQAPEGAEEVQAWLEARRPSGGLPPEQLRHTGAGPSAGREEL